jgi:lysophospholipase L1-like esterase
MVKASTTIRRSSVIVIVSACCTFGQATRTLFEWRFGGDARWNGWSPNGAITDPTFRSDGVSFTSMGHDPIMVGPMFELDDATNLQWVEVDLEVPGPGSGQLYYTNTTEGRYGGFRPEWVADFTAPEAGRQTLTIWPFWASLGKIIRLRLDPPQQPTSTIHAIRIMALAGEAPHPSWSFGEQADSWQPQYAVTIERTSQALHARARLPQAMIMTPVAPIEAARQSVLTLDADCPGERLLSLYWNSDKFAGMHGEPVVLSESGPTRLDLRRWPMWKGKVTNLAIAFGTTGDEVLTLRSLRIERNDPAAPCLRATYFDFERGIHRVGQANTLRIALEHAGGPDLQPIEATLYVDEEPARSIHVPAIEPGGAFILRTTVVPSQVGDLPVRLAIDDQTFTCVLRVDEPVPDDRRRMPDGYEVPVPQPVETDYRIGVYYFPGWYPSRGRWESQAGFPERDSLLGWYREGEPEVADWHIKWAVENGISFFIYDWYWRDGEEHLQHGLNEGFLKARYRDRMQFAIMWANHAPYASHTPEQLIEVTDYWIEHYFRQPNYLMLDGKPYVSFFSPHMLIQDLGSPEKVREAFEAMRRRAVAAGLAGIHFGACGGVDEGTFALMKQCGFDSITGYNYRRTGAQMLHSPYRQFLLGHESFWKRASDIDTLRYIPLLTVGWDSVPWHGDNAERRFDRRPSDFADVLRRLKSHLDERSEKLAILEAWNEWGEGSYIEPNVEFGFEDLEAIRDTFAGPGDRPVNVGPDDLGLHNRYDFRFDGSSSRPAEPFELSIPDPRDGDRSFKLRAEGSSLALDATRLEIDPADRVEWREIPVTLVDGKVQSFRGGNRLPISATDKRNLTPDAYVPNSLRIIVPGQERRFFHSPADFIMDDRWGAFEVPAGSSLKIGTKVLLRYQASLRRIDSLVLTRDGEFRVIRGEPSCDCPMPPELSDGDGLLANIYRPFQSEAVLPAHVYVPSPDPVPPPPLVHPERLEPVLRKLRSGDEVTIVCWGDSVTVGGDASTPEKSYVGLFKTMLAERFPDARIEVINAGIGGSNTRSRFPQFQAEVLDHQPDLVTLEFVNDMGTPDDELASRYPQILERVREAGAELLLITPHFTRPDWMGLKDARGKDPRTAVAFLRRFSREHQVPLADASRRWEQLEHLGIPYETLLRNGINHPDDRGHRIFAEELMRYFPANGPVGQ